MNDRLQTREMMLAELDQDDEADFRCPTCNGKGTVNPLTAPPNFFCVGTTECPTCDGTGEMP